MNSMNYLNKIFGKDDTLAIKGVALLCLIYHHCFLPGRFESYGVTFYPLPEKYMVIFASFLKICVGMFVFMSGFGMIRSYKSQKKKKANFSFIEYTFDRYYALWSKWLFVFVACFVVCYFVDYRPIEIYGSVKNAIIDMLGYADFFETPILVATWWYMSLAFLLILVFPLLMKIYEKIDLFILPLVIVTSNYVSMIYFPLGRWLFAFVLGMYCADHYIFEKLSEIKFCDKKWLSQIIKCVILTLFVLWLIKFRQTKSNNIYYFINDGFIPAFIIYYCYEFIIHIKYLDGILKYLGKHSMNIFLTHSFIRGIYLQNWTYSFDSWITVMIVLLVESIFISVLIEWLIKLLRYDKTTKYISTKFKSLFIKKGSINV